MSELRFDGKVAIITGAGNGLGKNHALMFASRGAKVVVNDLGGTVDGSGSSVGPAQLVVDEIKAAGGEAVADTNSVSDREAATGIIKTAMDNYGRIDILVNNAGILRDKSFTNMTPEFYNPVLDVHLQGTVWTTQAAWGIMRQQTYGRIINTTSAAGLFGNFGQTNYAAAKMGIVGVSRVWAIEGAKYNIKVNVLAPGALTRMTEDILGDMAKMMRIEQVSPIVGYLAHEECPVTGEIYSAAAGRVARVFVGATQGYYKDDVSIEDIRDNFDTVREEKGYAVPSNAMEEMGMVMPFLQK